MKPNTPHSVFTTEHSIAVGGHFFSFANIQDTVFGLVHTFCVDSLVTNTETSKDKGSPVQDVTVPVQILR